MPLCTFEVIDCCDSILIFFPISGMGDLHNIQLPFLLEIGVSKGLVNELKCWILYLVHFNEKYDLYILRDINDVILGECKE